MVILTSKLVGANASPQAGIITKPNAKTKEPRILRANMMHSPEVKNNQRKETRAYRFNETPL
jgi:hypothetical protein